MEPALRNIVKQKDDNWEIKNRGEIPFSVLRNKQKRKNTMKVELWLELCYFFLLLVSLLKGF